MEVDDMKKKTKTKKSEFADIPRGKDPETKIEECTLLVHALKNTLQQLLQFEDAKVTARLSPGFDPSVEMGFVVPHLNSRQLKLLYCLQGEFNGWEADDDYPRIDVDIHSNHIVVDKRDRARDVEYVGEFEVDIGVHFSSGSWNKILGDCCNQPKSKPKKRRRKKPVNVTSDVAEATGVK
jgi:hypothetical protein